MRLCIVRETINRLFHCNMTLKSLIEEQGNWPSIKIITMRKAFKEVGQLYRKYNHVKELVNPR